MCAPLTPPQFWGYRCDEHEIVTEGGWILKAHRISDPRRPGAAGYPVVLQHGILCNSSHFFMCEERSMAFWLVDQGYDVWVTNIRANFDAGHTEYDRWDPRFWAWGIKELAFDLRDTVEFITGATGRPRLAYIGHSQGSGSMYLALSPGICPEIGHKISSFTAIGPSVYAGPVLRKFPFSIMRKFRSRKWWSLVFGIREFIPAISIAHKYLPAYLFGHLAYVRAAVLVHGLLLAPRLHLRPARHGAVVPALLPAPLRLLRRPRLPRHRQAAGTAPRALRAQRRRGARRRAGRLRAPRLHLRHRLLAHRVPGHQGHD
jgi:hypothetical protein